MAPTRRRGLWQQWGSNRHLAQGIIYRVAYPAVHPGQDVGIGVQGLRDGGVPQ